MKNYAVIASTQLFLCFVLSCTPHYSTEIKQTLQMAGNNSSELKKVLKHYTKDPADSLKLRAAEFLIENMPGKYSEYYDAPWNDVATVRLRWTSSSDKQQVLDTFRLGELVRKNDVEHITADYLINNIDLAFKVWNEVPWGRHISFDVFCEEILPYRVGSEPLENWREKVLSGFADIYKSFTTDTTMTSVEACSKVNALLPRFRMDKDFPWMSYSQLMATTRGTCDAMAALAAFAMRGLGIPVTIDYAVVYTGMSVGHSWNAVRDSTGRYISFMGAETSPGRPHQATTVTQNKIYRKTYAIQKDVLQIPIENRPPLLQSINILDVSSQYEGFFDIRIPLTASPPDSLGKVYLAVLSDRSERNIVARGHIENGYGVFSAMGGSTGYFPVYYKDNNAITAGEPFILNVVGNVCPVVNGPFNGPHILSSSNTCVIPMRDFDIGGEGVAFHETDAVQYHTSLPYRMAGMDLLGASVEIEEPEYNLANISEGEWTRYTVEVKDAGIYICQLSASGKIDGKFHLKVDGENVTGSVDVPSNGAWFNWKWVPETPLQMTLTKGTHEIQFYCEKVQYNVKEMKLTLYKRE